MTFGYRLKLYLFGFLIGLLILAIILKGKSCARPADLKLQEITFQNMKFDSLSICKLNCLNIKASDLKGILNKDFKVNFDRSEPRANPFGKYYLEKKSASVPNFSLVVEDRDTISFVKDIILPKEFSSCDCENN